MRLILVLLATSTLAACGGAGPQSAGSVAAPTGGGSAPTTGSAPGSTHTFAAPTETKTYQAQGAAQKYQYNYTESLHYDKATLPVASGGTALQPDPSTRTVTGAGQSNQLYAANAATVRNPGISVTYDPRNAQYSLAINQNGESQSISFQDPAHRTDFAGASTPQSGVPDLEINKTSTNWRDRGVQYLQVDSGSSATIYDVSTFFYELPGTTTKYVTYAGFVRNHFEKPLETVDQETNTEQWTHVSSATKLTRYAFVFGEQSANSAVPTTGTATFNGNMIASMVNNPDFDINPGAGTYFQWIKGTAQVAMDFGKATFTTNLTGTTLAPLIDSRPLLNPSIINTTYTNAAIPAGAAFAATGAGRIDLVQTGGFVGSFSRSTFTWGTTTATLDIVGSSIDGAFYGPTAQEVGASFRIVGGIPDQRVDIIGSFTGKQ